MPECGYCHAETADKKCGACKDAWYCSRECQKSHYKVHKHTCAGRKGADMNKVGVAMDDDDILRAKQDFDLVCEKYNFRSEAMSAKLADFLTTPGGTDVETSTLAEQFGMTMEDANKFMMWIQIGTRFKRDVIDKNAEMMGGGCCSGGTCTAAATCS